MDFELTAEQKEIRALARDFALAEVAPVIRRFDEAHEFPHEILAKLGKTGLLGALDEALKYMKQRSAFGRTLAEFNGLQGMIADMGTEVEAARLLTLRAALLKDRGQPARVAASMAKVFASEVAMKAATKALQIHGGAGYITEFPIERMFRDAKLTEIGEGTSEIQRMVIARELLGFR